MRHNRSFPRNVDVEIPTTALYVPSVVDRTSCEYHEAQLGQPCHRFESIISDRMISGICNGRARKAGMTSPIRPQSLNTSLSPSGQSYRGQR